jgi:hypothetical protein
MNSVEKKVEKILGMRRRNLRTNTQKVLYSLLKAPGKWVARVSFRVPSTSSRLRDLRTEDFGNLPVKCARVTQLPTRRYSVVSKQPTFYKLELSDISAEVLDEIFGEIL